MIDRDAQKEAYLAAACSGDLEAVKRHFQLAEVQANVAIWNAAHRSRRLYEAMPPECNHLTDYERQHAGEYLLALDNARTGGVTLSIEITQWFFAREQLDTFGETLQAIIWSLVHNSLGRSDLALEVAEIVFESPVFAELTEQDERVDRLTELLRVTSQYALNEWVELLHAYGADPNGGYDPDFHTPPITCVAYHGDRRTFDLLLANGAWLEGNTLLFPRAYCAARYLVDEIIRRGADVNVVTRHGSPIHHAASRCFVDITLSLIVVGFADVDARNAQRATPLMVVGENVHFSDPAQFETAQLLLKSGADIHAVDAKQRTALHHAVWQERNFIRLLLRHGADPNHQDARGRTPIVTLLSRDEVPVVKPALCELLEAGADPCVADRSGQSAVELLEATEAGRAFMLEKLAFFRRIQT